MARIKSLQTSPPSRRARPQASTAAPQAAPVPQPASGCYAPAALQQGQALLGGLSPQQFMQRYWQRKPLLVRQAMAGVQPPLSRTALFELAGQAEVESRLIVRTHPKKLEAWTLSHGPFARRALPPLSQPRWTLLVQGLDLHVSAAHRLLTQFRFVPQARLDDLMISYATDGGGVGPHFDSYDVFLLQVHGRRRWRIGRLASPELLPGVPLKILRNFRVEQEWVLEPGDMLYLPPMWAHDGIAEGECMTCSVGFRTPLQRELAHDLVGRLLDFDDEDCDAPDRRHADPGLPATSEPGRIPPQLAAFGRGSVAALLQRMTRGPGLDIALGEALTEPKPGVFFDAAAVPLRWRGVSLHPRSRMMYDERRIYLNGESWRAAGADARLMRRLADHGRLDEADLIRASEDARELLADWLEAGWVVAD